MAEEKTYTALIDQARYKHSIDFPFPIHSPKKYKKTNVADKRVNDIFKDKEIGSGSRVIIRCTDSARRTEVTGYMLGTVVDMEDFDDFWTTSTSLIVEVTAVSNEKLKEHVGRLRHVPCGYTYFGRRHLVAVGQEKWKDYIPSQEALNGGK